jgi:outer membrane lipoprotein-sorting protein
MKQVLVVCGLLLSLAIHAQDADALVKKIKAKYEKVNDYEASGKMKTNVSFMKVPEAKVKIYYKKPDKLKIKNENGISFVPKGSVNINMGNIFGVKSYTAIDAGTGTVEGITIKIIKIIPEDETSGIVLSTLYIDEKKELVVKTKTTTRDNGTYELSLQYGKYAAWGLPDKAVFTFSTKDYKLPKGVTIDYDNGSGNGQQTKSKTGKVELTYSSYTINKGLDDSIFK